MVSVLLPRESVDEMFFVLSVGISVQGTALNSCVYIVDYISESLSVPVIKDWVEWSCEQMISQRLPFYVKELCFWSSSSKWHVALLSRRSIHIDGHLHDSIKVQCLLRKRSRSMKA